jgi:hypothetical protein
MARDLKRVDNNKATFIDGPSGGDVSMYYRTPTNKERIAYSGETLTRKAGKIASQATAAGLKWGAKIMTGIEDGDFLNGGKPISSNEGSEGYDPEWKRLVLLTAGDLVQALAQLAFSGIGVKYEDEDDDGEGSEIDMSGIPGMEDDEPEPDKADAGDKEDGPLE